MAKKKAVKKKRKQKWRWMRYRKGDHTHNLMCAAQRWIHANGGTAVVLGGIDLLDERDPFSTSPAGNYRVCVGALGIIPKKDKSDGKK